MMSGPLLHERPCLVLVQLLTMWLAGAGEAPWQARGGALLAVGAALAFNQVWGFGAEEAPLIAAAMPTVLSLCWWAAAEGKKKGGVRT